MKWSGSILTTPKPTRGHYHHHNYYVRVLLQSLVVYFCGNIPGQVDYPRVNLWHCWSRIVYRPDTLPDCLIHFHLTIIRLCYTQANSQKKMHYKESIQY